MYKLDIEVMAKAKNHTDNIDSVTLLGISKLILPSWNGLSVIMIST